MTKRFRGNPNWGRPMFLTQIPNNPTMFERQCMKLGLATESAQLASKHLREWSRRNYKIRYVPERLIVRWGLASQLELEDSL